VEGVQLSTETQNYLLLINDGKGHFKDEMAQRAPSRTRKAGMITDAPWIDVNGDEIK